MEKSIKKSIPLPLDQIWPILINKSRFVILETERIDRENRFSYLFIEPVTVVTCFDLGRISQCFGQLEGYLNKGYWAAGFFSYEMGYGWEEFRVKRRFTFPLIWLGIFNQPILFDHREGRFINQPVASQNKKTSPSSGYYINDIRLNEDPKRYINNIRRIKEKIAKGLTYQVNYTLKCKFRFKGSSFTLYKDLRNTQPVAYSAFIRDNDFEILSFSPELFFRKKGRLITVRPMKGTISRGKTEEEDKLQMSRLKSSQKERSENIMIVDLLRNDLGRIAQTGTVKTVKLYNVERYNTLFQMTSTIQARLKNDLTLYELFRSLFPSGSVTGAPKISTTGIIRQLEKEERRVYTGAIGFFKPNRDAVFNVAIRTLLLRGDSSEMGIGSGIIYDSEPEKEYIECKLKAMFFTQKAKDFNLIETMLWSGKTGFFLLNYHLERVSSSATYFNFCFDENKIRQKLREAAKRFSPIYEYRIRLLLFSHGEISINYQRLKKREESCIPKVTLAQKRVNSGDVFIYHKTTNRQIYDQEYERARKEGFFEVIFENEKNEITEGAISNIFIRMGKTYYTPPISCGLLNGVYRQFFMKRNSSFVRERVLKKEDLLSADAVYLTNSVRGMTQVRLF